MTISLFLEDVPIDIQTYWIQERKSPMNEFVDLMPREESHLPNDDDRRRCHKRIRSSTSLIGCFRRTGPQEHSEDVTERISTPVTSHDARSHPEKSNTAIHICDCSYSTLEELVSLPLSSADLSTIDEIHLQNIHKPKPPEGSDSKISRLSQSSISASVVALLQQTTPKRLILRDCNLQVSDLFEIMEVLRRNHSISLELLDLRYNGLAPRVLQWLLSIHLGSFHSLKEIYLRQGIRCMVRQSVRDAIVEGLEKNRHHTLQTIDLFHWDRSIEHLLDVNSAGRRVFQLDSFPMALWPLLLQRATTEDVLAKKQPGRTTQKRLVERQASVLYYMLRNGPVLLKR